MKECSVSKDYSQLFKSERNICLISNTPGTITIEDNNKFGEFYLIEEDNNVKNITANINQVIKFNDYNPADIVKFALDNDMKIEYLSYAAICQIYIQDSGRFSIPDEYLPTYNDLNKVIVDGNDLTREMNYCETFGLYPEHFDKEMCLKSYSKKSEEIRKFSYAKCISSCNGFNEGEIYRIGKIHSSPLNYVYYIVLSGDKEKLVVDVNCPNIEENIIDNFIFINNTDISSIPIIKKIFDLLQD